MSIVMHRLTVPNRPQLLEAQAVSEGRRAYVLVNNRAEGNAPLTVQALVDALRG